MEKTLAGGLAGLVATAPMTAAMELMHRQLPPHEQYPLPPRQITMNVAQDLGVSPGEEMSEEERVGATLAAHFAYGAACGAIYSQVAPHLPGPPVVRGIGFGLAVWTGSYLGLLPAAGILSSAKHHPGRRNALMIAAHVVWGAATGLLTESHGQPFPFQPIELEEIASGGRTSHDQQQFGRALVQKCHHLRPRRGPVR